MTLSDELNEITSVFIDTAPIIYYLEDHPQYGSIASEAIKFTQVNEIDVFTSVITLTEVLPKPVQEDQREVIEKFTSFLKSGDNLTLIKISEELAEAAGRLRGRYPFRKTMDAIQLSVAMKIEAGVFITNDVQLKKIDEIKIHVLRDCI